ncbi:hypothetical protein QTO34_003003 [Cnephaeus nilssonii]|uniref:Uncharacterized protein n=1 Tax=Cnephaeus nilssonii TaxID=3371016 RepID=A0AA40LLW6_CNENI|nr:hypothetical protein QTO34_003003 [Eptesicus nilssonii]
MAGASEGPMGPAEDAGGGTRGGQLHGCRHQFSASSSFPLATRRSERLPIGVPLGVADRAGWRHSDWRVARGKLVLVENWCRQPGSSSSSSSGGPVTPRGGGGSGFGAGGAGDPGLAQLPATVQHPEGDLGEGGGGEFSWPKNVKTKSVVCGTERKANAGSTTH